MLTVLAYALVVVVAPLGLTVGVLVGGTLIALLVAWTSASVRVRLAAGGGGLVGIAVGIAASWLVFRWLDGPASFTVGPFVWSAVTLTFATWNDADKARKVRAARQNVFRSSADARGEVPQALRDELQPSNESAVIGQGLGLVAAVVWFVVYANR